MPNPDLICVVSAGGTKYQNWKTVEVTHSADSPVIDHCMLTVAEISSSPVKNLSSLKLKPLDPVTVTLAGQPAINGFVYLRQAFVDATQHSVQIGICSPVQPVAVSTVDCNPGQYLNKTLTEIGQAVCGPVGVNFHLDANTAGADYPFKRFQEIMGETRFDCMRRACQMRNIHMMDDNQGGLIGFRGAGPSSGYTLQEGRNILRGRILLQTWDEVDTLKILGQDFNNDSADDNRQTKGETSIGGPPKPVKYAAPEPGPNFVMQMAANHEKANILLRMIDGDVTVPGWLTPDGTLWMRYVRQMITVVAPTLLPGTSMQFMIKGVVHRQSDAGTVTDILLCDMEGFGITGAEPFPPLLEPGQNLGTAP